MQQKIPKNTKEFFWTRHAIAKMRQYQLSEQKVRSVVFRHVRKEEGIAPHTIAVMQPSGSKKNPTEIWIMFVVQRAKAKAQIPNSKQNIKKIITAWRYPGVSPARNPIPEEILRELTSF